MKSSRVGYTLLAVAVLLLLAGGSPQAFHSGGVAECGGCHSMHSAKPAGSFLLVGTDPSSTCLSCHMVPGAKTPSSYHIATANTDMPTGVPPVNRTPGGDFGWLQKTYSMTIRGTTSTELGQTHGHNIVAADTPFVADTDNTTSPGGTFQSSRLGCESCHDPHGGVRRLSDGSYANVIHSPGASNAPVIGSGSYATSAIPAAGQAVGAYRLLRGLGDNTQGVVFTGVAIAVAPSTYNRTEAATQTRVAYGSSGTTNTWGNWCATCHQDMHSLNSTNVHPIDESLGSTVANNYNAYVKSGDLTGSATTSFTSLVPFAENTGDFAALAAHAKNDNSYLQGPSGSDRVMCLSCHRAHASGWPEALRWNMEGEFMIYNGMYPGLDTTGDANGARGRQSVETAAAYYDRPVTTFATYQRVLCNKCHAKD